MKFVVVVLFFFRITESGINLKLDGKIVGGVIADVKDFPYQLSLRTQGVHFCGASIISQYWALTAAHCLEDLYISDVEIFGASSIRNSGGVSHHLVRTVEHERYNSTSLDYDVALLRVSNPFRVWNKASPEQKACLPSRYDVPRVGTLANTSGWGSVSEESGLSDHLMSIEVPIVSRWECQIDYPHEIITIRMLCAGYRAGARDACQGDSGGPLVSNGRQIGIVSWGSGCARPYSPGVYTNVAAVRDWIKKHTRV